MSGDATFRTVTGPDGQLISVTERGSGHERTIVLLHGYPDDQRVWDPIASLLAERFRVVTYDVRGAGSSGRPRRRDHYALHHLLDDFLAVIDAVSPDRPVHLVGHDWGSVQSWEFVCSELTSGRIESFTSISGPPLDHVGRLVRRQTTSPPSVRSTLRQATMSLYVPFFLVPGLAPSLWRHGSARVARILSAAEDLSDDPSWPGPQLAANGLHGLELYRANVGKRLRAPKALRTDVPTQVIVPAHDRYVSPALASGLTGDGGVAPGVTRIVPGGHWVIRRDPDRIARLITEHVEGESLRAPVAVVTGAGSGIGRSSSLAFAERGMTVVIADLDLGSAERTALLCRLLGADATAFAVDVSDSAAMEAFAKEVEATHGAPSVVVNNAGIGMAGPMLATTVDDWDDLLGVNLWGVIHGCRLFAKQMVSRGEGGHIINVASASAFAPSRSMAPYATSKAAVVMLSECLRAELTDQSIAVSAVCPGFVDTGIAQSTRYVGVSAEEQDGRRTAADRLYRRRGFTADQVAEAVMKTLDDRRPIVLVGAEARAARAISRFAPRLARRIAQVELTP